MVICLTPEVRLGNLGISSGRVAQEPYHRGYIPVRSAFNKMDVEKLIDEGSLVQVKIEIGCYQKDHEAFWRRQLQVAFQLTNIGSRVVKARLKLAIFQ